MVRAAQPDEDLQPVPRLAAALAVMEFAVAVPAPGALVVLPLADLLTGPRRDRAQGRFSRNTRTLE
jgi:hypothetical protein